jgi:methylated-DNA-protein-cysteine methyltransferase related protein
MVRRYIDEMNDGQRKQKQRKPTAPNPMVEAIRQSIRRIPRGMVASYGQVAEAAGYPRFHRQVAQLLRTGGSGLPWHRVLGAGGLIKTTGEARLEQRMLLEMEGVRFRGSRVDLKRHQSPLHG